MFYRLPDFRQAFFYGRKMTIYSDISKVRYEGNGTTKSFAVPFYFLSNADGTAQIAVFVGDSDTALTEGSDYTVSGIGDTNGGTVIFTQAPASGTQIAITRNVPHVQSVKFIDGEDFPANEFERALDKKTMEIQELQENLARAIVLPPTSNESPLTARAELLAARTEAVKAANTAVQAANEASNSETSAANSASEATAAQSAILDNSGFQAVAADLTGPNNIGYVAANYSNIAGAVDQATAAAIAAGAAAQSAQETAQTAQETIAAKTEEFNANAAEKQAAIDTSAADAANSALDAANSAAAATEAVTNKIGEIIQITCTDDYVPNGCLPCDGSEYTKAQFESLWTNYLANGNLETLSYTDYAAQVTTYGYCNKFAIDTANNKFKVPTIVHISERDPKRILVESYHDEDGNWYNVYSDGWIEQGGIILPQTRNDNFPVTLLKPYKDTSYNLITNKSIDTNVTGTIGVISFWTHSKTETGFTTAVDLNVRCNWRACGYATVPETTNDTNTDDALKVFVVVANGQMNQSTMDWSAWASSLTSKVDKSQLQVVSVLPVNPIDGVFYYIPE